MHMMMELYMRIMMILKKINNNELLKTEVYRFGFFMLFSLCLIGCETKEITADEIVQKSIDAHGGIESWNKLTHLEFDKTTILYTQDGTIEKEIVQRQLFLLKPTLEGSLRSKGLMKNDLYFHGDAFSKVINDSVFMVTEPAELEVARNTFFAAHYVVCQPFKLQDKGVILDYIGEELLDGKKVHTLNVSYSTDDENSDIWTYYFDIDTYQLVANKVDHNGNISMIQNLEFDSKTSLTFNAHRKSYTILENDSTFLRAEYFYKNFNALFE